MDYRDQVFMAVAEQLSFSRAAESLFISQPAVTKHIRELESKLNTPLFDRKGNKIHLTKAGLLTYRYYKQIKQKYEEMTFEIGKLTNAYKGVLRIGASSTIAQYMLPQHLASFHQKYPHIELFLLNGNSLEMEQKLMNNEIDLALVENISSHPDIKYSAFAEDEVVAIAGRNSPLFKRTTITLAEIQQFPLVVREKGSGTLENIEEAFRNKSIDPTQLLVFMHLGSTESIKNFLVDFDGIGFVSEKSIQKELMLNTLKQLRIEGITIKRQFRTAVLHGYETSVIDLFVQHLNRVLGGLSV